MKQQGASKSDISEVNNYFSTKKSARVQMLHEAENKDAREQELAWRPAHEVVGAAFQPLVDVLSPQRFEPETAVQSEAYDVTPKDEVGLALETPPSATQVFGTDVVYIGKGDGSGQSTKASTQQLWSDESKLTDLKTGRRPFLKDIRQFRKANKAWINAKPTYWNKAPVQQLWAHDDDQTDLNKGRRPFLKDVKQFRKANTGWIHAKPTYWNQAPVQQLFADDVSEMTDLSKGRRPFLQDVKSFRHTNSAWLQKKPTYWNKAPVQQLFQRDATQALARRAPVALPDAGEMGTDKAFLVEKGPAGSRWFVGMGDGAGQSTAAAALPSLAAEPGAVFDGPFGTNSVFMGKGV